MATETPDEDRPYRLDVLAAVTVYALDEDEARLLVRSTTTWVDWDLIEVQACDPERAVS